MLTGDASDANPAPRPGVRSVVLSTWTPRGPSGHLGEASQTEGRGRGGQYDDVTFASEIRPRCLFSPEVWSVWPGTEDPSRAVPTASGECAAFQPTSGTCVGLGDPSGTCGLHLLVG